MESCRNMQDMYKGERMNIHGINSEYLKYMEFITATEFVFTSSRKYSWAPPHMYKSICSTFHIHSHGFSNKENSLLRYDITVTGK